MIEKQFIHMEFEGTMEERDDYFKKFGLLLKEGIFKIKNGKAILNFGATGEIEEIELHFKKYKRSKTAWVNQPSVKAP